MPIVEGAEIAAGVLIDCPATLPKLRKAWVACPQCEHFDGIAKKSYSDSGEKLPWDVEFCIRCRYPMERLGKILVVEEE
ncbi:MAG: hypothetical protein ABUJ92_00015 [Desulfobacterales bacterium]